LNPPPASESWASLGGSASSSSPKSSGTSSASLSSSVSWSFASIHLSGGSTTSSPSSLRTSSESSSSSGSSGMSSKSSLAMSPMLPDIWRGDTTRSEFTVTKFSDATPRHRSTQKRCAPARLQIEFNRPYQAVWYGYLL